MRLHHFVALLAVSAVVTFTTSYAPAETDCGATYGCFVDRQYLDFFSRPADPGGRAFYVDHLCAGTMSAEGMVHGFLDSPEFADTVGFVARCYFAIFNDNAAMDYTHPDYRLPDHGGLVFWLGVMRQFLDADDSVPDELVLPAAKLAVVLGFISSDEWQDRVGNLSDSEFVEFLYNHILGRASETGGFNHWLGLLQSGAATRDLGVRDSSAARNIQPASPASVAPGQA